MSVITEFTIPASAFALERTFEAVPDVTVEVERLATHSREWIMPFMWTSGADVDAVEDALEADPTVEAVELVDERDDIGQFKIEWAEEFQTLIDEIVDQHGIVQEAEAAGGTWYLELKFVHRDDVSRFQTYFHERDRDFELHRLYEGTAPIERKYDLTAEQREIMVAALERGYFAVPREAQLEELAAEFDVSTNAVSQRLRRATRNLAANTLTVSVTDERARRE